MNPLMKDRIERINELYNGIQRCHKEAKEQKRIHNSLVLRESKIKDKEAFVQYEYCKKLEDKDILFQEQAIVPSGRIDVLTSTEIIEIKYGSSRQAIFEAIGQLSYYSIYYPNHFKKIVITDQPAEQSKKVMKSLFIEWEVFKCSLW